MIRYIFVTYLDPMSPTPLLPSLPSACSLQGLLCHHSAGAGAQPRPAVLRLSSLLPASASPPQAEGDGRGVRLGVLQRGLLDYSTCHVVFSRLQYVSCRV